MSIILLVFVIMSSQLIAAADLQSVSDDEKTNLYNILDSYYMAFIEQNMDAYLSTQFLAHLSDEDLTNKKALIKQMWSELSTSYALNDQDSCEFSVDDSIALVTFDLSANIEDLADNSVKSYDQSMTATFFKTKNGWKIFNIVPTSVFEFNAVVDLLPEPKVSPVDTNKDDLDFLKNFKPDDISCDEQGRCSKRGPSLIQPKKVVCNFDIDSFKDEKGYSLVDIPAAKTLIGNDKLIKITLDDSYIFYYHFADGFLKPVSASEDVDFSVTTDSCTLQRIDEGSNPQVEYDDGNIKIKGEKFGSKIKSGIAKLIFDIYSWFAPSTPFELWIEAETGTLNQEYKYSFIGPTSRGPGELYLGAKDSFARYEFESDYEGTVNLYLRINDDGLHPSGSRNAILTLNDDSVLKYNQVSKNTQTSDSAWAWEYVGTVTLKKGKNTLVISKPEQTSAAFVLDKFVFSEEKLSFT